MTIISFDTIPSTNAYCRRDIDKLSHGDIVTALRQSAGRGRKQRHWSSEEGGLYFSLVLKKDLEFLKAPGVLTQLMALAVCKAVRKLGVEAYIKWPNDVLAGGRKFCGILSEAVFEADNLKAIIIGAGINISQSNIKSEKPAVTLEELGVKTGKDILLKEIVDNFNFNFSLLKLEGFEALRAEYKKAFIYLGKVVALQVFDRRIEGIAEDIDADGRLVIRTGGEAELISIGDMDF